MATESRPIQVVETAYGAWSSHGPRAFAEFVTDLVELHDAPQLPDGQTWIGRVALVQRLEELVATTGGRWADIDDVRPVGDEVVVGLTWRFDQASPATLGSVYHVVRVEGDRISRIRVLLDETEATQAALAGGAGRPGG